MDLGPWIGRFGEIVAGLLYYAPEFPRMVVTSMASGCWTRKGGVWRYDQQAPAQPEWIREGDAIHLDPSKSIVLGLMEVKTTTKPKPPRSFRCQPWESTAKEAKRRGVPWVLAIVRLNPKFPSDAIFPGGFVPYLEVPLAQGRVWRIRLVTNKFEHERDEDTPFGQGRVVYRPRTASPEEVVLRILAEDQLASWVSEVSVYGRDGFELLRARPNASLRIRVRDGAIPEKHWLL